MEAEELLKRFGSLVAVDRISFQVREGECYGFLGPNGAGKTTTMRMVCCTARPTAGSLRVFGLDVRRHGRAIKRQLGVVHQSVTLDDALTVRENLVVYGRYFDLSWAEARRRADELLAFAELEARADERVSKLSGGMQRRLMIARALMANPRLLVLDEPTTGLDPQARHAVWDRLRQLKRGGVTQILTTHYMEEAEHLCDRVAIVDHGRIVAEGPPRELVERYVGREVVELQVAADGAPAWAVAEQAAGLAEGFEVAGDRVFLHTRDGEELVHRVRALRLPVEAVVLRRATLEDVFLRLTGRRLRE
ncbi:MAG: ATP-binding cassette domain-containing protein [Armatimonadota bacterium]|nr:ATP-binding cassette domain-containing protein [Armatimonadota bacterium]MDR5690268.1 ATP-binding cassette domain-containing protein [Armatimonadota bacterium]MDR7389549.1 ATP-binding cassette domain-containing protein [Armatimonadota bacterium]MDR7393819.1 ATP-binding cassette domain-containing protein [Armatimonadota bacterium]MDR7397296.1 ATP-binding cassette domain-containing protein [Armatimonadota bacterium]